MKLTISADGPSVITKHCETRKNVGYVILIDTFLLQRSFEIQSYDIIKDVEHTPKVFVELQKQFIILCIKSKNAQEREKEECRRNITIVSLLFETTHMPASA